MTLESESVWDWPTKVDPQLPLQHNRQDSVCIIQNNMYVLEDGTQGTFKDISSTIAVHLKKEKPHLPLFGNCHPMSINPTLSKVTISCHQMPLVVISCHILPYLIISCPLSIIFLSPAGSGQAIQGDPIVTDMVRLRHTASHALLYPLN